MTHAESSEFRAMIDTLGLAHHRAARLFAVNQRSIRRWRDGDRHVPYGVGLILRLVVAGAVTLDQIKQIARRDAKPEPEPESELEPEPESEPTTPVGAEAPRADPSLSTAERVVALTRGTCRYPIGDPARPGFRFCSDPIAGRPPYCAHHHTLAYKAPPACPQPTPAGGQKAAWSHPAGLPPRRQPAGTPHRRFATSTR
jgi:hypothetical protein